MLYLRKLEGIIFYITVFLVSIQLGKHFWPEYAFVNGIRLDYLSPTLYLSDIFIVALIFLHIFLHPKSFIRFISKSFVLPLFLLSLLVSSIFAQSFETAIYWSLKIIEVVLLSWVVLSFRLNKKSFVRIIDVFALGAVIQSLIAVIQFVLQRSIGGPLYYLGERSFDVDTIGISTFFNANQEFLRPYGTFPHPNVLALYLSIALVLTISYVASKKISIRSYTYSFVATIILIGLLVTVSRIIILFTVVVLLMLFLKSKRQLLYAVLLFLLLFPSYLLLFSGRFLTIATLVDAFAVRIQMIGGSLSLISNNLLFGLGPNNTFFHNPSSSLSLHLRFQPVHNVYLQILLQLGLIGLIPALFFVQEIGKRIFSEFTRKRFPLYAVSLLCLEVLIVGLFDHFLVTLQQGLLIGALLVGFLFNKYLKELE